MSNNDKSFPVNVDIGAKAEAKLSIEARVPEESSGRFIDAITDIIRPWSEKRGLKADQIRLQREEVVLQIAKIARDKIILESEEFRYIPTKILVPMLEAASLEEPENVAMQQRWANLLASAAKGNGIEPRFSSLLKEITGRQAHVLELVAFHKPFTEAKKDSEYLHKCRRRMEDVAWDLEWGHLQQTIQKIVRGLPGEKGEALFYELYKPLNRPGCMLLDLTVPEFELDPDANIFDVSYEIDLDILKSLGLLKEVRQVVDIHETRTIIWLHYFFITRLRFEFICACTDLPRSHENYY